MQESAGGLDVHSALMQSINAPNLKVCSTESGGQRQQVAMDQLLVTLPAGRSCRSRHLERPAGIHVLSTVPFAFLSFANMPFCSDAPPACVSMGASWARLSSCPRMDGVRMLLNVSAPSCVSDSE